MKHSMPRECALSVRYRIAATRSVKDFKTVTSYRLTGGFEYEQQAAPPVLGGGVGAPDPGASYDPSTFQQGTVPGGGPPGGAVQPGAAPPVGPPAGAAPVSQPAPQFPETAGPDREAFGAEGADVKAWREHRGGAPAVMDGGGAEVGGTPENPFVPQTQEELRNAPSGTHMIVNGKPWIQP